MICIKCNSEMTLIIEENDYQQCECRGLDQFEPNQICKTYLEMRQENGWAKEWKSTEDR